MEKLKILTDDQLPREKSQPVVFNKNIENLAKDMFFTMKMAGGIGLAAPQVGELVRIITVDTTPVGGKIMGIMINPVILEKSGDDEFNTEGCLSFPEKKVVTSRVPNITVQFQDFMGNTTTRKYSGIDAICVQHEVDHLDGITMFERARENNDATKNS